MAASASSSLSDHDTTASKTMGFRRAHCLADGQLTPPSSPDRSRQRTVLQGPRLQLPKILRRPKVAKSTRSDRSVDPPDRPFVSMMTEPFPLLLPESPVDTDCSTSSTTSRYNPPELRRLSASYHDLRSLAARHSISKVSQTTTPLLPSPIIHDLFEQHDALFRFCNPRLTRVDGEYKSYEDLHILSCYYDDNRIASMDDIERELEDVNVSEASLNGGNEDDDSTISEDMPRTPTNRSVRDTFGSEESGWLANATSPSERMRKFQARYYQIMQHPMDHRSAEKDENAIMLATVLVGPGKPKVVQISRRSSSISQQSSQRKQPPAPPQTPTQSYPEISAFSPYDTPADGIDHRIRASLSHSASRAATLDPSYSTASLIPAPLSLITRAHSYQSSSTAFSDTREHLHSLANPFGSSTSNDQTRIPRRSSSVTAFPSHRSGLPRSSSDYRQSYSLPPSREPSPTFVSQSHPAKSDRNSPSQRNLPSVLASLTSAIDSFTYHTSFASSTALDTLHLSSSSVFDIRCPHIPDRHYIDILGKIFPSALAHGEGLRSALVAWIITDLHLCKAISAMRSRHQDYLFNHTVPFSHQCSDAPLPGVDWQHQQSHNHVHRKPVPSQGNAQHQYSYSTLVNQSNSSLHRIPTKARDLLGITLSPPPHRRGQCAANPDSGPSQHDIALLHRAVAVQQGVSVIGQKLVEALRGPTGFDEDVWRGLRVLVEVVEEGGWNRAGVDHRTRDVDWL